MPYRFPRWLLAAALLALPVPALAAGQGVTLYDQRDAPLGTVQNPLVTTGGGGGGTASTVNQGTPGASPWLVSWTGMSVAVSNATLAVTQSGAWTVGLTGALPAGSNAIGAVSQGAAGVAPWLVSWSGQSVAVSNFPASQPVTNAGTFAVQNTAAIVGGNTAAVKTDGSAVTQPVSAVALPLPTGAATVAGQTAVQAAPGTSAATANGVQGVTNGVPVPVSEASGANVTIGATTDAPLTAPASTTASTLNAAEKGILNALLNGTAKLQEAVWWTEANGTAVAASANLSGTTRSTGSTAGTPSPFGYFQVQLYTSQAGTLYISDGSYTSGSAVVSLTAVAAGSYTIVKVPALGTSFSALFTNGATAATVNMSDGFTAN